MPITNNLNIPQSGDVNPIVLTARFLERVVASQNYARDKASTEAREATRKMELTQHTKTVHQEHLANAQYGVAATTVVLLILGAGLSMQGEDLAGLASATTTATNVMTPVGQGINSGIQAKIDVQQHLIGEDQRKRQQADERRSGISSAVNRVFEAGQQIMETCGRLFVIKV